MAETDLNEIERLLENAALVKDYDARIAAKDAEIASLTEQLDDLAASFNETALKTHTLLTEAQQLCIATKFYYLEGCPRRANTLDRANALLIKLEEALKDG